MITTLFTRCLSRQRLLEDVRLCSTIAFACVCRWSWSLLWCLVCCRCNRGDLV